VALFNFCVVTQRLEGNTFDHPDLRQPG